MIFSSFLFHIGKYQPLYATLQFHARGGGGRDPCGRVLSRWELLKVLSWGVEQRREQGAPVEEGRVLEGEERRKRERKVTGRGESTEAVLELEDETSVRCEGQASLAQ